MNFLLAIAYIFTLSAVSVVALFGEALRPRNEDTNTILFVMVIVNIACVSKFLADSFTKNKK